MPKISDEEYARQETIRKEKNRVELLKDRIFNSVTVSVFLFAFIMTFRLVFVWKMTLFQHLIFYDSLWISAYTCSKIYYETHKELWGILPISIYSPMVRTL